MTTPPHKLIAKLRIGAVLELRAQDGKLKGRESFAGALKLAEQGLIEGVGPKSGTIKYLRELAPEAIEQPEVRQPANKEKSKAKDHPLNARTELGSYRQTLEYGSVWALCLLRNKGI